jgi:transposase-like protein
VNRERLRGIPHPEGRKVERPSYEQLLADVAAMSMCAVGRKYGVSDNAVRKWLRWYEAGRGGGDAGAAAG